MIALGNDPKKITMAKATLPTFDDSVMNLPKQL